MRYRSAWLRAVVAVFTLLVVAGQAGDAGGAGRIDEVAPGTPSGGTAANLWVAPGGSGSCVRAAVPVSYAAAVAGGNVCDTGPTAYAQARLGDTVLLEGGTYTTQWNFTPAISKSGPVGTCNYNYPGTPDLSNCITFIPAAGQSVVFQVSGSGQPQITACVNFLSVRNVTFSETDYVQNSVTLSNPSIGIGKGDGTCLPNGSPPHDIYLANNSYGGQAGAAGGAYDVWYVGGTATSTKDWPWQMGGQTCLNLGPCKSYSPYANHNGIVGMTFQGYNFANTDPSGHHMECIHDTPGSDHITIAGNRILGCPVESFFAQGNSQTNILVENNYFDTGAKLTFSCTSNGCVNQNITVRFNSFHATGLTVLDDCNNNGRCTGAVIDNNLVYGNIGDGCPTLVSGMGSATGSGWKTAYNVETVPRGGICAGDSKSRFSASPRFVSPGPPAYDLRLLPGPALGAGGSGQTPARDIQGFVRPLRAASDAGAAQRETAQLVIGRSVGAVSLGMSAAGVALAYGLPHAPEVKNGRRTVHYRIDGRRNVWLRFERGIVVAVETTSPYYSTLGGLGVGSSASDARAADYRWTITACRKAYRSMQGGQATYLIPRDGRPTTAIASVVLGSQDRCRGKGA